MTTINLAGVESIDAQRLDDEYGSLQLVLVMETGERVNIAAGRFYDDAAELEKMLRDAADHLASNVIEGWKDVPDGDSDGFVYFDNGRYYVSLEGSPWENDVLQSRNDRSNWRPKGYPTREIAVYELACAMASSGYFPNAWEEHERGWSEDIGADVRAFHDEGGEEVKPLEGVEYENGTDVSVKYGDTEDDWLSASVVKDYGTLGIVYVLSGDDTRRHVEDRSAVRLWETNA